MENATKALLIAGSILIAILLIAMGVKVFESAKGTTDSAKTTMNATEIAMFNNKFIAYRGNRKTAAELKALANIVIAHNSVDKVNQVKFYNETDPSEILSDVAELSGFYTIYTHDMNEDGLIDQIVYYQVK